MLSQKKKNFRAHRVREQEFLSKARQRKDRNIVFNPDTGAGTSDNRCNECANFRGIYVEKVSLGLAQICLRKECSSLL
jgi:ribosomal protein S14